MVQIAPLSGPLAALLSGSLQPQVTLISDNVVQPGAVVLRELLHRASERNESVCLLCCDHAPDRLLSSERHENNLTVIDCVNEQEDTDKEHTRAGTIYADIEDLATIEDHAIGAGKTTLVIDSLNTLETFNGSSAVYRFLKRVLGADISLVAVHHTDVPSTPSTSSSPLLLSSLLSPAFASSTLHLTLHSPGLLAHLHYSYSIEQVGQEVNKEAAAGLYDFLPRLHARHWASPLHPGDTSSYTTEDADAGSYDSHREQDIVLDLLNTRYGRGCRCVVEYSMRGINKSNKRSEAAKIARGVEGMVLERSEDGKKQDRLLAVPVAKVLRIKARRLQAEQQVVQGKTQPDPISQSLFNLSLSDRQREAREGVELPYTPKDAGEIVYQPDSADDVDDSDPDEDLEL